MSHHNLEDWEEEFDFSAITSGLNPPQIVILKDKFRFLLSSLRQKVEGMKIPESYMDTALSPSRIIGYNMAIRDILSLLPKKDI